MAVSPPPILRFGCVGQAVQLLQKALNAGPSAFPRLTPDAQFGFKTHARLQEFQGQKNLPRDGVAGPGTWEMLAPLIEAAQRIPNPAALLNAKSTNQRAGTS